MPNWNKMVKEIEHVFQVQIVGLNKKIERKENLPVYSSLDMEIANLKIRRKILKRMKTEIMNIIEDIRADEQPNPEDLRSIGPDEFHEFNMGWQWPNVKEDAEV